ncbi:MAG: hypothetical protein WAU81_04395 [Candidatus Aminicenantales bacterium]
MGSPKGVKYQAWTIVDPLGCLKLTGKTKKGYTIGIISARVEALRRS